MRDVILFTDGSCLGNPGRGGWGSIVRCADKERELSGGYAHTTNNRMEIMAAIAGLELLNEVCAVVLYTDSQYLRNAVEKKWLAGWQKNGWKTAAKKPVKNRDLWERLQHQLNRHKVTLEWVRGHNGHPENERCDELARMQASRHDLPDDTGYEEDERL
ncbi:MAG: ribonuclease HI [Bilophila sp.]